jgi:hypothetical protein
MAQRLDRAKALRRYEPARGLAELEALHAMVPEDRRITFAYASARLTEGDASAVKTLSMLAKDDARWRVRVFARLCIIATGPAIAAEPAVATAWLAEGKAPLAGTQAACPEPQRVDALIIAVDPFDSAQRPNDVDAIKDRQRQVLTELIEPDALPIVISFNTTEPLPAALSVALERHPAAGVYRRDGRH